MIDDIEAWGLFCEAVADDTKPTPREIGGFARRLLEQHLPTPAGFTEVEVQVLDKFGRVLAVGRGRFDGKGLPPTKVNVVDRGVAEKIRVTLFGGFKLEKEVSDKLAIDKWSVEELTVSMSGY
ncbi:MAG: hypothetical protein ACK5XA_08675 [Tagaea sp.]